MVVTVTGGDRPDHKGGRWYVPKKDWIARLQSLLEKEELRIAKKLKETGALVRELVDMRVRGKSESHDDLVLAVALACRLAERPEIGYGRGRLPGI